MNAQSNIRIIGGKWRSRKVSFATKEFLRPTPDRVRETVFNWLAPHIVGANCLDLYAGSGVLSLEALSRGALAVVAVEQDLENVNNINANKEKLQAIGLSTVAATVVDWLQKKPSVPNLSAFNIVFIDPPYKMGLLAETMHLLEQYAWLAINSFIYFEHGQAIDQQMLPETWSIWRESKASQVYYYLAKKEH